MESREKQQTGTTCRDAATSVTRRGALALGAAASALLLGSRPAAASIRTGAGIAGGGWATWETGEAQLSVFGSRFEDDERDEPVLVGSLRWTDVAGFTLTSETITRYEAVEPVETTRALAGFLRNSDGDTLHAFALELVDAGGPGEELDRLTLTVGPAIDDSGATPTAEDTEIEAGSAVIEVDALLEVGDLQLLTFEFPG